MDNNHETLFLELVGKGPFYSFHQFEEKLEEFQKTTGTVFAIRSSATYNNTKLKTPLPAALKYASVLFRCVHFGTPRIKQTGKRPNQKYFPVGCEAEFSLAARTDALFVLKMHLQHKNHDISVESFMLYPRNRRLTEDEKEEAERLLSVKGKPELVRGYLLCRFGKTIKSKDLHNLRCKSARSSAANNTSLPGDHAYLGNTININNRREGNLKEGNKDPSSFSLSSCIQNMLMHRTSLGETSSLRSRREVSTQTPYVDCHPILQHLYSLFTPFAMKCMRGNHKNLSSCTSNGCHVSVGTASFIVDMTVTSSVRCSCTFNRNYLLPCLHICHLLTVGMLSVEEVSSSSSRWLKSQSTVQQQPLDSDESSESSLSPFTAKRRQFDSVCKRICDLTSRSGLEVFSSRLSLLEKLMKAWEEDRDVELYVEPHDVDDDDGLNCPSVGLQRGSSAVPIVTPFLNSDQISVFPPHTLDDVSNVTDSAICFTSPSGLSNNITISTASAVSSTESEVALQSQDGNASCFFAVSSQDCSSVPVSGLCTSSSVTSVAGSLPESTSSSNGRCVPSVVSILCDLSAVPTSPSLAPITHGLGGTYSSHPDSIVESGDIVRRRGRPKSGSSLSRLKRPAQTLSDGTLLQENVSLPKVKR